MKKEAEHGNPYVLPPAFAFKSACWNEWLIRKKELFEKGEIKKIELGEGFSIRTKFTHLERRRKK